MARVVLLDASVLIGLWQDSDLHHEWCLYLLGECASDDLVVPAVTLAEVLVYPVSRGKGDAFLANMPSMGIKVLPFLPETAISLAETRLSTRLKMPDALVLCETRRNEATLATADKTLIAKAKELGVACLTPFD